MENKRHRTTNTGRAGRASHDDDVDHFASLKPPARRTSSSSSTQQKEEFATSVPWHERNELDAHRLRHSARQSEASSPARKQKKSKTNLSPQTENVMRHAASPPQHGTLYTYDQDSAVDYRGATGSIAREEEENPEHLVQPGAFRRGRHSNNEDNQDAHTIWDPNAPESSSTRDIAEEEANTTEFVVPSASLVPEPAPIPHATVMTPRTPQEIEAASAAAAAKENLERERKKKGRMVFVLLGLVFLVVVIALVVVLAVTLTGGSSGSSTSSEQQGGGGTNGVVPSSPVPSFQPTADPTLSPTTMQPTIGNAFGGGPVSWELAVSIEGDQPNHNLGQSIALSEDGDAMVASHSQSGPVKLLRRIKGTDIWAEVGEPNLQGSNVNKYVVISSDGSEIAMGESNLDDGVRVFQFQDDNFKQIGQSLPLRGGEYVIKVALNHDGTVVAIGDDFFDDKAGRVQVYEFDKESSLWIQIGEDLLGSNEGDNFGTAVALSLDGLTLVVGANQSSSDGPGYVRVFQRGENGNWLQLDQDLVGETDGESFGIDVAVSADGGVVAVGAKNAGTGDGGRVHVYQSDGLALSEIGAQQIVGDSGDRLGWSVDLSSDGLVIAVGSFQNYVRVYRFDTNWVQLGSDITGTRGSAFGLSVDISGDGTRLVVAARWFDGPEGDSIGRVTIYNAVQQ